MGVWEEERAEGGREGGGKESFERARGKRVELNQNNLFLPASQCVSGKLAGSPHLPSQSLLCQWARGSRERGPPQTWGRRCRT